MAQGSTSNLLSGLRPAYYLPEPQPPPTWMAAITPSPLTPYCLRLSACSREIGRVDSGVRQTWDLFLLYRLPAV